MPVGAVMAVGFIASTAYQIDQSKAAERDAERAQETADRARRVKATKERRQMARNAIKARAEAEMAGVVSGGGSGSSAVLGSMASITSQEAGSRGFSATMENAAQNISNFNSASRKHSQLAGYGGQAANLFLQAGVATAGSGSTGSSPGTPAGKHAPVGGTGAPSPTYGM